MHERFDAAHRTAANAPLLLFLLRAVQGFSTGGEYTGASAVILLITSSLDEAALNSWGWRIPFLLAGPLGLIGLYLRSRIEDTPVFRAMEKRDAVQEAPLREAMPYRPPLTSEVLTSHGDRKRLSRRA